MTRWLDPPPVEVPDALRKAVGGLPLVAETLVRRGVLTASTARAFLDPAAYLAADPADLPDLAKAVGHLQRAIELGNRIAVWGDFDADGQTATALLLETLRTLGVDVVCRVPTRQEGHGLHPEGVERLIREGSSLILSCDTGVMAHDAVARANQLGAQVIITDHHVPGDRLPPALAVINPHRLPEGHPMGTLPGVGVAYQVARALDPAAAEQALDLVALGTVADVAKLIGDARYLVQRGLASLRTTARPGLQAVYAAAELRPEGITEEHIGFVLGPRLNALGRLADAAHGVELLTTRDPVRARILAAEVEGLNAQRRWLTKQVTEAAVGQIERKPQLRSDYHALVLSHPTWPGGVIGIVAGRLAEQFGKPTVLISAPPGQLAQGSGRSVPGLDLVSALADCRHLLAGYGGHQAAAGFSIEPERIPELRAALSRAVEVRLSSIQEQVLTVDDYVELPDLTMDLVEEIGRLAPFGAGNPPLTLVVRGLRIVSTAVIGSTQEHLRVTVEDGQDRTQTVFWWQAAGLPLPRGRFDLALTVRASDYRGASEVQTEWLEARELEPDTVAIAAAAPLPVRDYRDATDPESVLRDIVSKEPVLIWAESAGLTELDMLARHQLVAGQRLAIWTLPPSPEVLQAAMQQVQPDEVLLFAFDPHLDEAGPFLSLLAGMAKFALRQNRGQLDLQRAAARTAQTTSVVQAGLEWLAAQGKVDIPQKAAGTWRLAPGLGHPDQERTTLARARLDALLAETAAYRSYFRTAPAEALVARLSLTGNAQSTRIASPPA